MDLRKASGHREVGLFRGEIQNHVAVVGPSGAGKTHGLLIPWIVSALREGASVVAVDVKGNLFDEIDCYRRQSGPLGCQVVRLDYTRPHASTSWNWVADLRDPSGLPDPRSIAGAVEAILGKKNPNDSQPFFYQQDCLILESLLSLVATSSRENVTATHIVQLLGDQLQLEAVVNKYAGTSGAQKLSPYVYMAPPDFVKATSGVRVALGELAHPPIERVTRAANLDLQRVIDEPFLVLMVAPLQDGRISEVFSGLVLNRLIHLVYRRLALHGGNHVVLVLDEAARLADRVRFEEVVSVARSAGVTAVLALQDVAQFRDDGERSAVLSNCSTYVSLSGVSAASADYLSNRLGTAPSSRQSVQTSRDPGRWQSSRSTTHSTEMTPVLGNREIMAPPFGQRSAIVHCRDVSDLPFVVDLSRA